MTIMIDDDAKFKVFLKGVKDNMDEILGTAHIGHDVTSVLNNIRIVFDVYEARLSNSSNHNYSAKIAKKKTDQLILEKKALEKSVDYLKTTIIPIIIGEIKSISTECNSITVRENLPESPNTKSAETIKKSVQKIIDSFTNKKI